MPNQYPFWLGGVAASISAACTHPLDLAKANADETAGWLETARNVQDNAPGSRRRRRQLRLPGLICVHIAADSMVRIGAYETIKGRMTNGKKPSTSQLVISGAVAGGLGGVAGNPADIVLVRMTTDARLPAEKQRNYRNAIDGVIRIVRDEGASALMRGVGPNTVRAVLMTSSQMATYDVIKNFLMTTSYSKIRLKDGLGLHVVASGVAGLVATTICSPADVIKSRIMAKENGSIAQLIRKSLRNEGPQFLFKGWTPSFIRLAPNTILLFVILEQLKGLYRGVLTVSPS